MYDEGQLHYVICRYIERPFGACFLWLLLMCAAHVPSFWWEHSRFLPTIRGWFPLNGSVRKTTVSLTSCAVPRDTNKIGGLRNHQRMVRIPER